jgi:hypothetical protein
MKKDNTENTRKNKRNNLDSGNADMRKKETIHNEKDAFTRISKRVF